MSVSLDGAMFWRRLEAMHKLWQGELKPEFGGADVLCIITGKNQEAQYQKSQSLHLHLIQYEFPELLMLFTSSELTILSSEKKLKHLQPLLGAKPSTCGISLTLLPRNKADGNAENYAKLTKLAAGSGGGKAIGFLQKESPVGPFAEASRAAMDKAGLTAVDVSKGLSLALAAKDEAAARSMAVASKMTARLMRRHFVDRMEEVVDEEKKVKHAALSNEMAAVLEDGAKTQKLSKGVSAEDAQSHVEVCFDPIVQSGATISTKLSAQSNSDTMRSDIVTCSLGVRFKSYCSHVARTFLFDPVQKVQDAYVLLQSLQEELITKHVRPGKRFADVSRAARAFVQERDPELLPHLSKNAGHGVGFEIRDSSQVIGDKNQAAIRAGSTLTICVSFADVPLSDAQRKSRGAKFDTYPCEKFSLILADVVTVGSGEKEACAVLTSGVPSRFDDVQYAIGGDSEEEEDDDDSEEEEGSSKAKSAKDKGKSKENRDPKRSIHDDGVDLAMSKRSQLKAERLRREQDKAMGIKSEQEKLAERQKELAEKHNEEMRQSRHGGQASKATSSERANMKNLIAYSNLRKFPLKAGGSQILCDTDKRTVLLPINGAATPFHISTIKSVTKAHEGKITSIRFNFYTPSMTLGKEASPAIAAAVKQYESSAWFIKELSFKTEAHMEMDSQFRRIKELQRSMRQKVMEDAEKEDLVEQANLEVTRMGRVPRLQDVSMRPPISGKKCQGTVAAHKNGLRFTSVKREIVDILYSNVRHAVYQPCENSLYVIIHFVLRNGIMTGKKKHVNIQFFTEVVESSQALDDRKRSSYDPDELDEEQRERQLKKKLNAVFKVFAKDVEKTAEKNSSTHTVEFDMPYRDLGFHGTPNKEMVLIMPSVNCILSLDTSPVFCEAIKDIEHVHFERTNFGANYFDLVLIFKEQTKPSTGERFRKAVQRISSIEMKSLGHIQEWLNDISKTFTQGAAALNWKNVIDTIASEDDFYDNIDEDGQPKPAGWDFLNIDEQMEGDDDEEDEDDESAFEESEDEESSSSEDESDFSEEESSEEDESDFSEEDSGEDWDEMERKAAASDKKRGDFAKRGRDEDEDEGYGGKKKKKKSKK